MSGTVDRRLVILELSDAGRELMTTIYPSSTRPSRRSSPRSTPTTLRTMTDATADPGRGLRRGLIVESFGAPGTPDSLRDDHVPHGRGAPSPAPRRAPAARASVSAGVLRVPLDAEVPAVVIGQRRRPRSRRPRRTRPPQALAQRGDALVVIAGDRGPAPDDVGQRRVVATVDLVHAVAVVAGRARPCPAPRAAEGDVDDLAPRQMASSGTPRSSATRARPMSKASCSSSTSYCVGCCCCPDQCAPMSPPPGSSTPSANQSRSGSRPRRHAAGRVRMQHHRLAAGGPHRVAQGRAVTSAPYRSAVAWSEKRAGSTISGRRARVSAIVDPGRLQVGVLRPARAATCPGRSRTASPRRRGRSCRPPRSS